MELERLTIFIFINFSKPGIGKVPVEMIDRRYKVLGIIGLISVTIFIQSCIWIKIGYSPTYFKQYSLENTIENREAVLYWINDQESTDLEKAFYVKDVYLPDSYFQFDPHTAHRGDSAIGPHNKNLILEFKEGREKYLIFKRNYINRCCDFYSAMTLYGLFNIVSDSINPQKSLVSAVTGQQPNMVFYVTEILEQKSDFIKVNTRENDALNNPYPVQLAFQFKIDIDYNLEDYINDLNQMEKLVSNYYEFFE